jgi:hypothetical protein
MQYYFVIGNNYSIFAKTDRFVDEDALKDELKQREPDIEFPEDPRLQCVFPITEQEFKDKNQSVVVKRISQTLDKIIAEMNDNKRNRAAFEPPQTISQELTFGWAVQKPLISDVIRHVYR